MDHILTGCPYSRITWHEVLSWIRSTAAIHFAGDKFADWWETTVRTTPAAARKGTSSVIMITAWWLWKLCNAGILDGAQPDLGGLLDTIKAKAASWAAAGALGIAALLQST